jgi:UDP-3-O-[3-hydroxymyristoyl] glucosamine N-acyltransferase
VNANAKIGENCIINSKALIEHDAAVGDNCHISTNSTLNGDVTVGKESFIASNVAFVNGKTTVGNVIVGIGSVVDKDLTEAGTYIGHPIRKIK